MFKSLNNSASKDEFDLKRCLFDAEEVRTLREAAQLENNYNFLFSNERPYIGKKLTYADKKALETEHFSALADGQVGRYDQMEGKYTQLLSKLSLYFNARKINKNTLVAKPTAIRNVIYLSYYNRALARAKQAKWQEALQDLNNLLALDETHVYALFQRGLIYSQMDSHNDQTEDFKKVYDYPLNWHIDLPSLLDSKKSLNRPALEVNLFNYPPHTLFFIAPNELHYLAFSGVIEIIIIQDLDSFINKVQALTTEISTVALQTNLGLTLSYFPRFIAENARLRLAIAESNWNSARQIASTILQSLPAAEARTPQEIIAASELDQILRIASSEDISERVLPKLRRKSANTTSPTWRSMWSSSKVLSDHTVHASAAQEPSLTELYLVRPYSPPG